MLLFFVVAYNKKRPALRAFKKKLQDVYAGCFFHKIYEAANNPKKTSIGAMSGFTPYKATIENTALDKSKNNPA